MVLNAIFQPGKVLFENLVTFLAAGPRPRQLQEPPFFSFLLFFSSFLFLRRLLRQAVQLYVCIEYGQHIVNMCKECVQHVLSFPQHQHCLALALLSISIAQHQHCLALTLVSISIGQHWLALALVSISIGQHQHCLALRLALHIISIAEYNQPIMAAQDLTVCAVLLLHKNQIC